MAKNPKEERSALERKLGKLTLAVSNQALVCENENKKLRELQNQATILVVELRKIKKE